MLLIIGERLKKLRKEKKKTQEDIAKFLEITRGAYLHIENERNEPDMYTLTRLADYFEVTTDYLLGKTKNTSNPPSDSDSFEAFKNNPDLAAWWRDLPESDEEKLQQLKEMWEIINRDNK